jgi:hypothetical protein
MGQLIGYHERGYYFQPYRMHKAFFNPRLIACRICTNTVSSPLSHPQKFEWLFNGILASGFICMTLF